MATNTEVAGISIGITADIGGLSSSLSSARQKIDSWMTTQQKKTVFMTVEAVKGKSWDSLEADLNKLVEHVTAGHTVPINVDLAIEDPKAEKARLETIVKNQLGSLMVPIDVKYTTDITINSHVLVTWDWADGHGPPTTMGGGGGNGGDTGGDTGGDQPKKRGKKRAAATGPTETETDTEEPPPKSPVKRKRGTTQAGEGGTVSNVRPDKPKKEEAEKPAGGGIAGMPTTTPKTAAAKATAERQAENTAAYVAETGEQIEKAAKEWRDVTKATFMRNLQRQIPGVQPLRGVKPEALEGATGFQAEYEGQRPTGAVAYLTPSGQRRRLLRSPQPRTFEGTTHGERPVEGTITMGRRGDPNDPRRGLADPRTMSWFDPAEGFVDPQVRREGQRLFNEAMAVREKEVYESLKGVVEQRQGETEQDFAQRLMRDWTQQGWGFNKGKTLTTKASTLEGISEALKLSPAMGALDKLRTEGKFGEFFGDEAEPGALKMRAEMQSLIRARSVKEAQTRKGEPLTEQERKAALSKGTQRATRLRGEGLPVPGREEEAMYVQLNAMIGQAFKDQYFAEQKLAQQQAAEQGAESTITNEMVAAFTQIEGERPVAKGTKLRQVARATGKLKEVIDRDKGLRTEGEPHPKFGMFQTKVIPEMEMVQEQAGEFVKRLKGETNEEYGARVEELQQDWDQGLRDFGETFEMPAPGAARAPRPRARQKVSGTGSQVGLTEKQQQIKEWSAEYERLGDIGPGGEGYDEARLEELEQLLADAEAGRLSGSRRTRVMPRERRITRAEGLVSESQRKLEGATDPAAQAYYQRQLRTNQAKLSRARMPTTAEKGLTGPHRRESERIRAETGFCEYCGTMFEPGKGHADHPISRAEGGLGTGGPSDLVAACETCNQKIKKGQSTLEFLQNPDRPPFQAVDPLRARAAQRAVVPERFSDIDVLGLRGTPAIEGIRRLRSSSLRDRIQRGLPEEQPPTDAEMAAHQRRVEAGWSASDRAEIELERRATEPFVPVWRRRQGQGKDLTGSARKKADLLEGLGGEDQFVPDVRDIAEAMGIGRGGFSRSGQRIKMTAGSREKMQRAIKGSEVEKGFALLGDRYIDAAGRMLVDIKEVMEIEGDPRLTSATSFAATKKGIGDIRRRVEQTGLGFRGMVHGITGHGIGISTPESSVHPEHADSLLLEELNAKFPGFISGISDPGTEEALRFYQQGAEGPVQRRYNIGKNIPRMVPEPEMAQAAMPVEGTAQGVEDIFNQMSDEQKWAHVRQLSGIPGGGALPRYAQDFVNAQATGMTFEPVMGAAGNMVGLQQGFGLPAPEQAYNAALGMGPNMPGGVPPRGAAAAAARAGAPPPPAGPQWQQWGFFGQGGFVPPGGGNPPPPPGAMPPPGAVPPGGGFPQPGFPYGSPSRFQRSSREVREGAYAAGMSVGEVESVTQPHMIEAAARRETITRIQGQIAEDIAKTPVRAFTTAIGQYVSNLVVRGDVAERRIRAGRFGRLAERATTTAEEAGELRDVQQRKLDIERQKVAPDPDVIADLESSVKFETDRHDLASKAADSFIDEFALAGKAVAPIGVQMLNLGAITVSMLGAMIAFQAAMKVSQAAMDALARATYDSLEAMTGFNATLKRVQEELAKAAFETGGVQGAVATGFAQAGMEPTAEQRAAMEGQVGGVVAMQRATLQRDMLRVQENLAARAPGAQQFGIAPSLVQPTGGLFGTAIGATPSLDEIIGDEFERLKPGGLTGAFTYFDEGVRGFFDDLMGRPNVATLRTEAQTSYLDNFNKELASAGVTATAAIGRGDIGAMLSPEIANQAGRLDELGATNLAAAVRAGAVEFRDANGNVITEVNALADIIKGAGEALETLSPSQVYRAGEKARNAAFMGIEDQFRNQLRGINISEFRRLARNPIVPFGTTFNTGDVASQAAMQQFGGQFQDLRGAAQIRATRGEKEALNLGIPQADLDRLKEYGQAITAIRVDLTQRQLAVSTSAYEHQLSIAKRTLGDLVGLTGKLNAGKATAVGLAEAENLALQRQNTILGRQITARNLEMAQRQINFNLAVSQFTASGTTPAEAAARIEENKIEAEFAQKNLNDQKAIFGNEGQIFENQIQIIDETNLRALNDAIHNVSQLEAEHELEKYAAGAEEVLAMLEAEADFYAAQVDADIARAEGYVRVAQDEIRRVYVESGKILTGVMEDISDAFQDIREDYDEWLGDIGMEPLVPEGENSGYGEGAESYGGGGGGDDGGANPQLASGHGVYTPPSDDQYEGVPTSGLQTGALFNTTGTTDLTVGEAGKETVAVLRNPRQMSWGGGGGGAIVININNPVVRDNSDIEKIARAVEETLRQRAALVRPR